MDRTNIATTLLVVVVNSHDDHLNCFTLTIYTFNTSRFTPSSVLSSIVNCWKKRRRKGRKARSNPISHHFRRQWGEHVAPAHRARRLAAQQPRVDTVLVEHVQAHRQPLHHVPLVNFAEANCAVRHAVGLCGVVRAARTPGCQQRRRRRTRAEDGSIPIL